MSHEHKADGSGSSHPSKSGESSDEFSQQIYQAVLDGDLAKILSCTGKQNVSKGELRKIFESTNVSLETNLGVECAPAVVVASKYGHMQLVQLLIKEYNVNINATGHVIYQDGSQTARIEDATPLWCAAASGHMGIVKFLVENGAQVNKATSTNSTPLRTASFDGRLEIVRYLVQHKADINISTRPSNNSCLMISACRGHLLVVKFLLECGMDPNQTDSDNNTALHFAAEGGHTEICQVLIDAGAQLSANDSGFDQLLWAAEKAQTDVVMNMVMEPRLHVPRLRHIEALELLGAMLLNNRNQCEPSAAYRLLVLALQMRCEPGETVPKVLRPPIAAYRHRKECETLQELKEIENDTDLLQLEGLMIRERILRSHLKYSDLTDPIVCRVAEYADQHQYDRCLDLWTHTLRICRDLGRVLSDDLRNFANLLSEMVSRGIDIQFSAVYGALKACCEELHRSRQRCRSQQNEMKAFSQTLHTTFYLLALLCKLKMTSLEEQLSSDLVRELVKADFCLPTGNSLLHMACDPNTEVDNFRVSRAVQVPDSAVIKLLLECGANPNSAANNGDTPMHFIEKLEDEKRIKELLKSSVVDGQKVQLMQIEDKDRLKHGEENLSQPFLEKWDTVRLLGRGAFGEVHEVLTDIGVRCAAKTIRLQVQHDNQQDENNAISKSIGSERNLCQLHHEHIVRIFWISELQNLTVVLLMELIDGKPLREFRNTNRLDEGTVSEFSVQICSALNYLHSQQPPVIHRDINGNNIMVLNGGKRIKLIDFGLSVKLQQSFTHHSASSPEAKGTVYFMAPELFEAEDKIAYSRESDIWAFGCTVYQMVTGNVPHSGKNRWAIPDLIKRAGATALPDGSSAELKNFYACCVARDRKARKSAADLLSHPFLTGLRDEGATGVPAAPLQARQKGSRVHAIVKLFEST